MSEYSSYQPTDLPWVKKVPQHWRLIRNGVLLSWKQNKVGESFSQFDLLSLTTTGIRVKDINDVRGKVPASYEGYQEVLPCEMVFCLFDLDCSAVFAGKSNHHGMITSAYDVAMPNKSEVNPSFLDYWFISVFAGRHYKIYSKSVRYTINWDIFKAIKLPVPPRAEQDQIVRYLDWQVSKINKLIAAKKKQIALLDEHRTVTINVAVTRGVKDTRALKNSGMKWLPKIPTDWETIPAKALFENRHELRHDTDEMMAATQKYGIIAQKKYMEIEGRRIVLATDSLDKWLHVEPDDFIISLRSFQGGLEKCAETGCVTWHYVVLRPSEEALPSFYRWFFKSSSYISALQHTSDFIRDGQDLRFSNFVKVRLPRIPLREQAEIADYLDNMIPQYDVAIIGKQKEIAALHELRTRLISDVVTGQIDVSGIEVPDFEMVEEIDESADEDDISEETEE